MSNYAYACSLGYPHLDHSGYYVRNGEDIFHRFTNKDGAAIFIGGVNQVLKYDEIIADVTTYEWVSI
jgi:hypothetical protein